ncbi:MAG: Ig-like domain-containing protein [Alistipes sp.]|nr:Ig-like domain-containing protein [Alistipes sp.]
MRKSYTIAVRTVVMLLFGGAFFSRCANIMTPEGGPRDTIPPVIVKLDPDNFATNFTAKKIYIEFNEYVQIKDQNKEMFTSPAMKKLPLLTTRGKGIVLTIRDTLKENTTYAIDLGSAIRDNNEGNPLNAMRYVFSTGDKVDSMICSGYTADSYKADSVSRTFIWFYIADSLPVTPDYDSTIFNRKPDVIARAQNNGIFIAQNLKPVNYRIYAIGDKNDNQLYDAGTDLVGRLDSLYNPASLPEFAIWFDSLRMYPTADPQLYFRMFTDKTFVNQRMVDAQRPEQKKLMLYFNTAFPKIDSLTINGVPSDKLIFDPLTVGKDTMAVWLNVPAEELPDTVKGEIVYYRHDSLRQLVKSREPLKLEWHLVESKDQERERIRREKERAKAEAEGREYKDPTEKNPFSLKFNISGEFNPTKNMDMTFGSPAIKFDSTAVRLLEIEGEQTQEVAIERHFVRDTMNACRWIVKNKFKPNTKYRLYMPKGCVTDIMGYQNDSTVVDFTTFDPEKFATVSLKVSGVKGKQYILILADSSNKTIEEIHNVTSGNYRFNYVPPGEIRLRIIEDANGNGKWDAGSIVERLQPERAEAYFNDRGEDVFATKMNWDFEVTLDMSKIFREMTMENLIKMLNDKEESRLKKLAEEWEKKQKEATNKNDDQGRGSSGGMGFGGAMGGMGGLGGGISQATGGVMAQ